MNLITVFLYLIILVFMAIFIISPEWLLFVIIAARVGSVNVQTMLPFDLRGLVTIFLIFIIIARSKTIIKQIFHNAIFKHFVILIIYILFNLYFLVEHGTLWMSKFASISIGLFFLVFYFNRTRKGRSAFFVGIISGGFVVFFDVLYSNLVINRLPDYNYLCSFLTGYEGQSINPNILALSLLFSFICTFTNIYVVKSRVKVISLGIIATIFFVGMVLAGSRGAVLSAIILVMFIHNNYYKGSKIGKTLRLVFIGALILISVSIIFYYVGNIFNYKTLYSKLIIQPQKFYENPRSLGGGSLKWRVYNWQGSLKLIKEHPLFGVGYCNVALNIRDKYNLGGGNVHNAVLEILSELGIVGLIIFILFYYNLFKYTYGRWKRNPALLTYFSIIIGTLIFSFFHHYHALIEGVNAGCLGGIASEYYFKNKTKSNRDEKFGVNCK